MEIYVKMQGVSEFVAGGVMADMNLTGQLGIIRVPTLVSHGFYDTMAQPTVEIIHKSIPGSELVTFAHSGHLAVIDDNEAFNNKMHLFISVAEGRRVDEGAQARVGDIPAHCTPTHIQ